MNEISPHIRHIHQHIQRASAQLQTRADSPESAQEALGSLIYLGNHQDAIPRSLLLDPHLESGEIHTWALLKIHLSNPALPSAIPSQTDLMAYLKCSRPILSRHMQVLRALRWITLCAEVRGEDGQFRGHVYAQHDSPLPLQDTLFLDPGYLDFLDLPSSGPALKRLRDIKDGVLLHIDYQIVRGIELDRSPSTMEQLSQRLQDQQNPENLDTARALPANALTGWLNTSQAYKDQLKQSQTDQTNGSDYDLALPSVEVSHMSDEGGSETNNDTRHVKDFYMDGKNDHVKDFYTDENAQSDRVKDFYMDTRSISSSSYINTTTTTHRDLKFPKALGTERLRLYASKQLSKLPEDKRQYALDYLSDRIHAGEQGSEKPVGNALSYLAWIVRSLLGGTLPDSSYGIREEKRTAGPAPVEDKRENHEKWVRNLQNMGFELDASGRPVRKRTSVS